MGPWKNLKGIAGGILGSFLSRNNDFDGYWGMGILRLLAQEHDVNAVCLDLLAGTCTPPDHRGAEIARAHGLRFQRFLADSGLVRAAEITVSFGPFNGRLPRQETYGTPFAASLVLSDNRGKAHRAEAAGWCGPHDPRRECRRAGKG
jgi:hypothetical protein